jgi:hypothetical protein
MDFIERLFGVSPDGGDGSLERLYLIAIAAAIVMVCMWIRYRVNKSKRAEPDRQR